MEIIVEIIPEIIVGRFECMSLNGSHADSERWYQETEIHDFGNEMKINEIHGFF